ncbi:ornithine cyclodeaminase [Nakamurella flavida]|uniref:Ornithine cyclodeaminase n=1 Tax=Nakamurella flavida TaxID=363630 RepID=A0A938YL61_9ACTN|nr:ornithine cyclodeaminase [Nakamurella flavida]MBM9478027.1 ornithine cyclodeaminase [Nakamurella flavida]MDP9778256.1 ornithine cyclodeaminase [Nakamurella flavida]
MVQLVDVTDMTRWCARTGVEPVVRGMVETLREDFLRWPRFDLAPRVAAHSAVGVIELMPTSDGETYAVKYVNGHPANPAQGLQTVTAFGVLVDVATGYPVFLSEMTILTALRTAATSAMVAQVLARPDSRVMAMIGTGTQAAFQALAFRAVLGISDLRVFDVDPAAVDAFCANVEPLGFRVVRAVDAAEAVRGADIVTTCTADKARAVVLTDEMVRPGMHVNAIGGDCPGKTELAAAILHRASVFVEYEEQTRIEGEIQQVAPDFPVTELWRVLTGDAPGRTDDTQITVFDSVGFAIEDFSALRYLRDAVRGTEFVQDVDLVARPVDPKNLYALIAQAQQVAAV